MRARRPPWFLVLPCLPALIVLGCTTTTAPDGPRLSDIQVLATLGGAGPLSPPFSPGETSYRLTAASDIGEIAVIPTVVAPESLKIKLNGVPAQPGASTPVSLSVGENLIRTVVSDPSGRETIYTIRCIRENIQPVVDGFRRSIFTDPKTGLTIGYRLFVPADYDPSIPLPLVLFLHGAGESGSDNTIQLIASQGATVWAKPGEQARHPCFVLAPQNPRFPGEPVLQPYGGKGWTSLLRQGFGSPFQPEPSLETVYDLLQAIMGELNVDRGRVYATGLSMGGFGVLALGAAHPDLFAAIVSVCGGLDPSLGQALARTPIWLFHSVGDPVVDVVFSRATVKALGAGGSPRYTEYSNGTPFIGTSPHASWVPAYADAGMREWLFAQRRTSSAVK
jgi:predicted esterase